MLRVAIYLFVIVDVFTFTRDVIPAAHAPDLYQPTLVGRLLHLPTPTPTITQVLQVVVVAGALVAASSFVPRLAGWLVALSYLWWLIISMGYGYVAHDHMALVVAVFVLPTVGRAKFSAEGGSEAAGWALRSVQVAVVATYFCSAIVKWVRSGSPAAWANGAVFVWAIMRRGNELVRWTLEYPWLLQVGQWVLLLAEFLSPVVLFLRGKALYLAMAFFLAFHLVTVISLSISFLPTVVCWLAFVPLEKLVPLAQRIHHRVIVGTRSA